MKKELPVAQLLNVLGSGPTTILTSHFQGRSNLMACASAKPANPSSGLVMVSINRGSLTYQLVMSSNEFALNIPAVTLVDQVEKCGTCSGRDVDKIRETGLTFVAARVIKAPLIEECLGHIECKVSGRFRAQHYDLFLAEVVSMSGYEGRPLVITAG
jgi:flavin reductase (DIM6/NTAB) family NADH-FMN oxidoreductase RutF